MSVSIPRVNTTPVFQRNAWAYKQGWPIICNEGGSRSGKTFSIMQLLIGIACNEPGKRISVVSHSLPHIKRGAYRDFRVIMQQLGRWDENQWRATDFVYTFKNGSYLELFGLEDEGKARGPGRDILFINEANLINKQVFDQLAMRTTGTIFMDWNPAEFNSWVYDIADNGKNRRIHSTYLDNIHNLTAQQVEYIESFKALPDPFMWQVYGLGERGASEQIIYRHYKSFDEAPGKGDVFYGLDFGYTNPTALVRIEHYEGANYVEELIYDRQLTKPELFEKIKALNIGYSPIYADAAEPDSIEEMYRMGLNVKPGIKDVWAGIVKVKSFPLFIKGKNIAAEIGSYKWKLDKNDNVLEEPVKENDHAMDAMRYAIHTHLNRPPIKLMVI